MKRSSRNKPAEDRRRRFAEEYVVDFNASQAAVRAGYSKRTARAQGSRLLTYADVQAHVAELMAGAARRAGITVDRTQQAIARIAYGDIRKLFDEGNNLRRVKDLSEDEAAMLAGVESFEEYAGRGEEREAVGMVRKVKVRDTLKALEQCMSILGMHKTATPKQTEDNVLNLSIRLSGK